MSVIGNRRRAVALSLMLMASLGAFAQQDALFGTQSASRLDVRSLLSVDRAAAGTSFQTAVALDIHDGWHMQAAKPSFDYLVGTHLDLTPPPGIEITDLRYPPAKQIEFAGDTLAVYDGETPILFTVAISPDLAPGEYVIKGELTVQACDDQVCLAPSTLAVTVPINVVAAGTSVSPANTKWFTAFASATPVAATPADELGRLFGGRGLALTLLAMFLTGLALNLTPCVYPMLSVTVSIFGGQRDTGTVRVFFKALVYVLGMATMYSLLGLLAALTGGMFGGLMQNPWTLAAIGLLLAAMALSMFGLYELRPPAGLINRLGGATTAGIVGVYFSGLLVGVFAAPCIGPPIVALLTVVGARGDPWFGFGAFFVLSLGLGAPYLVLGTFSGLLQRLPKSGAWMVWVKKIFGVVLLAVGAFYLALGFLPGLVLWIPLAAAIAGGLYLGFIERTGNGKRGFRHVKWALGSIAVLYGVWQAVAMPHTALEWQAYGPELVDGAHADGNPVVLDFYADWCIPCHELDRRTFSHPDVVAALTGYVRLKVDMTRGDTPQSREAAERFKVQGVPTIVFLDADGMEQQDARVVGFLPPNEFLRRIPTDEAAAAQIATKDDNMTETHTEHTNRLIQEKSPYLLQHAHNPVDWYPWGEVAFEKARKENKPIFLSVGYSTCHWCHVMARESFENEAVAAILNAHFVAIKVDREERPDVDKVYMTYVQATTGGGWPMSVWLTPDLKPFLGGTYYPPEDKWGRPGFKTVLTRVAEAWASDRDRIVAAADDTLKRLREATAAAPDAALALDPKLLDAAYAQLKASYDPRHGGFGGAPKFPRPSAPDFMLRYYARTGTRDALDMTLHSLRAMAEGGMHDQLGGGFHRYSVDERWHVPHFEKMLYDQGQLACTYLDAYQLTRDPFFADVARGILDYVLRDMTGPEGQFYSAEDADSDIPGRPGQHAEGAFYVWEHDKVADVLGDEAAAIIGFHYGIERNGNVREDPHGEFPRKNVLYVAHSIEDTAKRFDKTPAAMRELLAEARAKLLTHRVSRPRPHLDDKTISAWNGLMISAYARAYQVLGEARYLEMAVNAAGFIRKHLYDSDSGVLQRRHRDGEAAIDGYADDYAFLIKGLLDLYEAGFDVRHLEWALALQDKQNALFWDAAAGGYFGTTGEDPTVLLRAKEDYDGAEPSVNSVSALNLLRLAQMTDHPEYATRAEETLAAFSRQLTRAPHAMPAMLAALDFQLGRPMQIVIAGAPNAADTRTLLREVNARFIPNKVVLLADGAAGQEALARRFDFIASLHPIDGKAAAYVCENGACKLPTTDPATLAALLDG